MLLLLLVVLVVVVVVDVVSISIFYTYFQVSLDKCLIVHSHSYFTTNEGISI